MRREGGGGVGAPPLPRRRGEGRNPPVWPPGQAWWGRGGCGLPLGRGGLGGRGGRREGGGGLVRACGEGWRQRGK